MPVIDATQMMGDTVLDVQDQPDEAVMMAQQQDILDALAARLQGLAEEQARRRVPIEERWLEDLRQYNGQYDPYDLQQIRSNRGSEAFVNLTRGKVRTFVSRLSEIVMPTADDNWAIKPTPIPELQNALKSEAPLQAPDTGQPVVNPDGSQATEKDAAQADLDEAQARCDKMATLMQDQLSECDYNSVQRRAIEDVGIYGTGVIKGPVLTGRTRTQWQAVTDGETTLRVGVQVPDDKPEFLHVPLWDFYPEMAAQDISNADFVFQRHWLTRKQLRAMMKQPGYLAENIKSILKDEAKSSYRHTGFLTELRDIAGLDTLEGDRYEVWEYHGPLKPEDLKACGCEMEGLDDDVEELQAVAWVCDNKMLRASITPLDTGSLPYSVYTFEPDGVSLFGVGIPRLMRNSQRVANGAWRMIMDNAALSVAGQVIVDKSVVQPENGIWAIHHRKIWVAEGDIRAAFNVVPMQADLNSMLQIYQAAVQLIDAETQIPQIAQGEQTAALTKTAQGMSILMNSANTVLRSAVKRFDDFVTTPNLTRLYDWNMQFVDDDSIKGDYRIIPLGTSALMERESQMAALNQVVQYSQLPAFGPLIKFDELLREVIKAARIDGEAFIKSPEEIQQEQQAAQENQQQPQPDPNKAAEIQARMQIAQQEAQMRQQLSQAQLQMENTRTQVAMQDRELDHVERTQEMQMRQRIAELQAQVKAQELALKQNVSVQQVKKDIGLTKLKEDAANQRFNAEIATKQRMGTGI